MSRRSSKLVAVLCSTLLLTGCALFGMGGEESPQQNSNDPLVMQGELEQKSSDTEQSTSENSNQQENSDGPTLRRQSTDSNSQSTSASNEPIQPELSQQAGKSAEQLASEGKSAYEEGDHSTAIEKYSEAIKKDSSQPGYHFNLGSLYFTEEDYQEARNHYQEVTRLDDDHELAHLYLGATYLELGNRSSARNHFNRVLEIDPNNEKAQQYLNQL